jgi:hypothetical protein
MVTTMFGLTPIVSSLVIRLRGIEANEGRPRESTEPRSVEPRAPDGREARVGAVLPLPEGALARSPRASATFSGLLDGKRAARAIAARRRRREELGCQPPAPARAQYGAWESSPRHARGRAAAPIPRARRRVPGLRQFCKYIQYLQGSSALASRLAAMRTQGSTRTQTRPVRAGSRCSTARTGSICAPGCSPRRASSTVAGRGGQRHDF